MIPRLKPAINAAELLAALRPDGLDEIRLFEEDFAQLMGQKHAVAFPYGRTGLIYLLTALGLKGKEIICPAYTCVVVPHAIVYSGSTPVFIDCAPDGFNMDLDLAGKSITGNTGAIVATSIFGYPVDLDRIKAIQEKHPQIKIIQDCAHSFAAEWKGRPVQKQGEAAIFGLNISKLLTSIFGGMVTTDSDKLYHDLKQLRDRHLTVSDWKKTLRRLLYFLSLYPTFWEPLYGLVNRLERSGILNHFTQYYDDAKIDMPDDYRLQMSSLEAKIGRCNIHKYRKILAARRVAAKIYFTGLPNLPEFQLPPEIDGATYSHFVVQVPDRKQWMEYGLKKGIQLGQLIEYNIPEMESYGSHPRGSYPLSAKYSRSTINLPVYGGEEVAKSVVRIVKKHIQ